MDDIPFGFKKKGTIFVDNEIYEVIGFIEYEFKNKNWVEYNLKRFNIFYILVFKIISLKIIIILYTKIKNEYEPKKEISYKGNVYNLTSFRQAKIKNKSRNVHEKIGTENFFYYYDNILNNENFFSIRSLKDKNGWECYLGKALDDKSIIYNKNRLSDVFIKLLKKELQLDNIKLGKHVLYDGIEYELGNIIHLRNEDKIWKELEFSNFLHNIILVIIKIENDKNLFFIQKKINFIKYKEKLDKITYKNNTYYLRETINPLILNIRGKSNFNKNNTLKIKKYYSQSTNNCIVLKNYNLDNYIYIETKIEESNVKFF